MCKTKGIANQFRESRILPVAVVENPEDGCRLAEALLAGGIRVLEITLRTESARDALRLIRQQFPDLLLGAGTILDPAVIPELVDDGIDFGISPGLDEGIVSQCVDSGLPVFPGVVTPSEITRALALGCKHLKFFPAEPAGGVAYLKAISAPFKAKGISFVPTGGITLEKAKDYWRLPEVDAVGGSWLADATLMKENRFVEITRLAEDALAAQE